MLLHRSCSRTSRPHQVSAAKNALHVCQIHLHCTCVFCYVDPTIWSGVVAGRKPPLGPAFKPEFPVVPSPSRPSLSSQSSTQSAATASKLL